MYNVVLLSAAQKSDPAIHIDTFFLYYFKLFMIIIIILAVLGLRCWVRAFSSCVHWRLPFAVVYGLLIAAASLAAKHGLLRASAQ